jgi:hypothetical protein
VKSGAAQDIGQRFLDYEIRPAASGMDHMDDGFIHNPAETQLVEKYDFFLIHGVSPSALGDELDP